MNPIIVWVLNLMACSFFCSAVGFFHKTALLFVERHCHISIKSFLLTQIHLVALNGSSAGSEVQEEQGSCKKVSDEDARIVMEELGMWSSEVGDEMCVGMNGALLLLEEKEAGLAELEAAFEVFDENGDGFISAEELQRVMQRLGFEEGMRLQGCKRMIVAYDEDGDGRIGFSEFKNMLELAE